MTVWTFLRLVPGPLQPVDERSPRRRARQAGVDDGHAPLVLEDVAVDVPEARQRDGELRPEDARRHLGDLVGWPAPAPGARGRSVVGAAICRNLLDRLVKCLGAA